MTPHSRDRRPVDPLSAEERLLAERLARSAPSRLPSPAVDAAILRAAHAAARPAAATGRRPRWPALVGIAATLVLAIGVAWQLRPLGEAPTAQGEHAPTAVRSEATGGVEGIGSNGAEPAPAPAVAPGSPPPPAETGAPASDRPAVAAPRTLEPAPVRAPTVPPAPAPPPAPPAPPAAVAEPAAATAAARQAADENRRQSTQRESAGRERNASMARRAAPMATRPASPSVPAPAPTASAITIVDLPPANDVDLPPAVWIERIRQRRDAGRPDDARASLALLLDAHPGLVLPDDLRALVGDPRPPAP